MIMRWLVTVCLGLVALIAPVTTLAAGADLCPARAADFRCYGHIRTLAPSATPPGYGPADFAAAYGHGTGARLVAVVGAYGDPAAWPDLAAYSRAFGLPVLPACPGAPAVGCFAHLDQAGFARYPRPDRGWATETALDVEAVHATCPGCGIVLVEATDASPANLFAAVDRAVTTGASIVTMSWGRPESAGELAADRHFAQPGIQFFASSGDSGYGVSYPAASTEVTAVGGTHLVTGFRGRISETAWSGAGSGCSRYEAKPAWQTDSACSRRSVADVSADADPSTGAAVYASLDGDGAGWYIVGGTSLAAPLVAGLTAAGSIKDLPRQLYQRPLAYDVAGGRNGTCPTYFCVAGPGYDGPTGVGSPAFFR